MPYVCMYVKVAQSCPTLWRHELYSPWNATGQSTGMGNLSLLQGIFPTQGSNPGLLHCRRILYQLSHRGSPGILDWAAYPFSWDLFPPEKILAQESKRGLLHCRRILYQLSHQGAFKNILLWPCQYWECLVWLPGMGEGLHPPASLPVPEECFVKWQILNH